MKKIKRYLLAIIAISLFGEMYFYPFQGSFRFSAGVLALSLVLLLENDIKESYIGILTGVSVLILRTFLNYQGSDLSYSIFDSMYSVFPASIYYSMFGILAYIIDLRRNRDDAIFTIISLFSIDVICNITESIISKSFNPSLFRYILLIGLIRSLISYLVFTIFKSQAILIRKKEHQKRYSQLNTLVSSIQAEMFYLKKSMSAIEGVMSKAMSLNNQLTDNDLKKDALDIAREVHEIKKDYYRVIKGFDNFVKKFENKDSMSMKDITYIIQDNINRFIEESNKSIHVNFHIGNNIELKAYYSLFTILNNLITNSIEAMENDGTINLVQYINDSDMIITLSDEGSGIEEDLLPYLFSPGFTTKFDKNTGQASTGIGLSHIKNIVDELNGKINIDSVVNKGTKFEIIIPLISLRR